MKTGVEHAGRSSKNTSSSSRRNADGTAARLATTHGEGAAARLAATGPQTLAYEHLLAGYWGEQGDFRTFRPHGTTDWHLIYTMAGSGLVRHAGGEFCVTAGDAVLIAPGTYHEYAADPAVGTWYRYWFHFHPYPHWREWLEWPAESPGVTRIALPADMQADVTDLLISAYRDAVSGIAIQRLLAKNALERILIYFHAVNPLTADGRIDPRIQQVVDFIKDNFASPLNLDRLASIARLTPSRFIRLFREHTGTAPMHFVEMRRLEWAQHLLEISETPIRDVAARAGYDNALYFSERFKARLGITPSQYRQGKRTASDVADAVGARTRNQPKGAQSSINHNGLFLTRNYLYLTTSNPEYAAGAPIKISFHNGPGNATDWIGLYKAGSSYGPGHHSLAWSYLNGTQSASRKSVSSGSVIFPSGLPERGDYVARFFANNGYYLMDQVEFTVAGD
jgi:AraC family transcriptional regulator of arabinose operon